MRRLNDFKSVWVVACETTSPPGEIPRLKSFQARELETGRLISLTGRRLYRTLTCPIPVGRDILVVMYEANSTLNGFHQQGWPDPVNLIDLHVEIRAQTNGVIHPDDLSFQSVLSLCGIVRVSCGNPDKDALANLEALFRWLVDHDPDLTRPLYRASYMPAAAEIERVGIPIDVPLYDRLRERLPHALHAIITEVDQAFGVYRDGKLNPDQLRSWLKREGLPIPVDGQGQILTDFDTLKSLSRSFPQLKPIKQVEWLTNQMKLHRLAVGKDSRNRTPLRPYRSKSGRNQPRAAETITGWSGFMQRLIKPTEGRALAEIDVCSEEFGEAAALSGDENMKTAYRSDDVYMMFAIQRGAAKLGDTKESKPDIREWHKVALLGIGYEMGAQTLARRLEIPLPYAREIIDKHRRIYRTYWDWSESVVDAATYFGILETRQGWPLHITTEMSPRAIRNFPLQAHGSEIIRLSCVLAQQRGVTVCMPIHDALLIEADVGDIKEATRECQRAIEDASEMILGEFRLKTKVETTCRYPEHYDPGKGTELWNQMMEQVGWRVS